MFARACCICARAADICACISLPSIICLRVLISHNPAFIPIVWAQGELARTARETATVSLFIFCSVSGHPMSWVRAARQCAHRQYIRRQAARGGGAVGDAGGRCANLASEMKRTAAKTAADGVLRLRRLGIDTYRENVAYLHRECDVYSAAGFQALIKVQVSAGNRRILAVLNVADDAGIVKPNELGLSEQAFEQLGRREGSLATVSHAEPPSSMDAVRRKIAGERLSEDDFGRIIRDVADNRYSKTEMSAFLVASSQGNLDRDEVLFLTRAMAQSGERLDWKEPLFIDKHF